MNVLDEIKKVKLVPVVVFNTLDEVVPTLKKLNDGNVPVAEICFRTPVALDAIKIAVKEFPNMVIGAGTVINAQQASDAINAGAKFIVSPGIADDACEVCKKHHVPYLPGIVTPTEIIHAINLGLDHLKFFPAGVFGGLKAIKALHAAFPNISFMPTGGVDNSNLKEFVDYKGIFAIGGSWLLKGDVIANCLEANKIIKGE